MAERFFILSLLLCGCQSPKSTELPAKPPHATADSLTPNGAHAPAEGEKATQRSSEATLRSSDAPEYHEESDRTSREGAAREHFGARVPILYEAPFLYIAAEGATQGSLSTVSAFARRAVNAYFHGRFVSKPDRIVSVVLFSSAGPYTAYCKKVLSGPCISIYGFYEPNSRTIIMNAGPGIGTLTHELVHPIVEHDFPSAPTWLNEGLASLFEAPVLPRPLEVHGAKNWRLPILQRAMASKTKREKVQLDVLFSLRDDTFRGEDESIYYALARYVCQWLDHQGKLWPFYRAWRKNAAHDLSGAEAFTEVVGMTPKEAHSHWVAWLGTL